LLVYGDLFVEEKAEEYLLSDGVITGFCNAGKISGGSYTFFFDSEIATSGFCI